MSLVNFKARNHPQRSRKRGADDATDDRRTPRELFDGLHATHRFTVDAAASAANALLPRYWTVADDGLAQSWIGERVWCNPPYSNLEAWARKARTGGAECVVLLLPANRTEQGWWQREVEPFRDRHGAGWDCAVRFLPGRLRFVRPDWVPGPKGDRPPFGCCLVIWNFGPAPRGAKGGA